MKTFSIVVAGRELTFGDCDAVNRARHAGGSGGRSGHTRIGLSSFDTLGIHGTHIGVNRSYSAFFATMNTALPSPGCHW